MVTEQIQTKLRQIAADARRTIVTSTESITSKAQPLAHSEGQYSRTVYCGLYRLMQGARFSIG